MKSELFDRLAKNSILAVFEAASKYLDEELQDEDEPQVSMAHEAYQEDLSLPSEDSYENWEGMPECKGFDAFEEDPEEYTSGKYIGIPRNQLIVSSPIQGMLKPSPLFASVFRIEE